MLLVAATGARHQFSPCFEPRLATVGPMQLHEIPANATDPGVTQVIEDGTNPRSATIDGAIWVGYLRTTQEARLLRITGEAVTMRDYPAIATTFDLLPSGAFWMTPSGLLHAATPCL